MLGRSRPSDTATTQTPETKEEKEKRKLARQQAICAAQDKYFMELEKKKLDDLQKIIEGHEITYQDYRREKIIAENEFNQLLNKNKILEENINSLEAKNAELQKTSEVLSRIAHTIRV